MARKLQQFQPVYRVYSGYKINNLDRIGCKEKEGGAKDGAGEDNTTRSSRWLDKGIVHL
jgi:hypothetical protein